MRSDHSLATDSWRMLTKSSSITRGTVFKKILTDFLRFRTSGDVKIPDLEITRHRKKPVGGSRYLKDKTQLFLFNAWYITRLIKSD